jgi:hypothetical protein
VLRSISSAAFHRRHGRGVAVLGAALCVRGRARKTCASCATARSPAIHCALRQSTRAALQRHFAGRRTSSANPARSVPQECARCHRSAPPPHRSPAAGPKAG